MTSSRPFRARCSIARLGLALLALAAAPRTTASAQGGPPQAVRVDAVRSETLAQRRFVTGEVRAARRSRVAGREPGIVLEMPIQEGTIVTRGALLARLDDRRLQLEKAQLDSDRAVLEATVVEREAQLELRTWQLAAYQELAERGSSFERELREAQAAIATARAQRDQVQSQIQLLDAQAALLAQRIADARILAPFDAVVIEKLSETGQWLGEGGAVCELASVRELEVWLGIPQDLAAAIRSEAAAVEVQVHAAGLAFEATNFRVVPQVEAQSRNFPAIVPLGELAGNAQAGMSASAWIATDERRPWLTIAKDAVMRRDTGAYVYVARRSGTEGPPLATPVAVETLYSHGERFVIRADGLQEGELLVVEGNERLFPQTPLAPLPTGPVGKNDPPQVSGSSDGQEGGS